jgi:O-methyltransferase involved in polyketide biosynthesis
MEPLREFKQISPTAFNQAYMRTFYGISHAKEIAVLVGAEKERVKLYGGELHKNFDDVPRFEARYKGGEAALEQFIEKHPDAQVLELGAGLSLHGLALVEKYPNVVYIETDLLDMIDLKREVIKKLVAVPPTNLYFSVANALDSEALQEALRATTARRPLAIYCEGFIDYLSLKEKEVLIGIIKGFLAYYDGAWITPDPSVSVARRAYQVAFMTGARERTKRVEAVVGQRYDDYAFRDENATDSFFMKNGFKIEKISQPIDLYSFKECKIESGMVEKIIEDIRLHGRVWTMTVC